MPVFDTLRKLFCTVRQGEEQGHDLEMAPLLHHAAEPAAAGLGSCLRRNDELGEPGRPYRDFVEDETRKYWQETVQVGRLKKPGQKELRKAARPVLGKALRRRQGKTPDPGLACFRAHQAVCAMQRRAVEKRWIRRPFTSAEASPGYIEALVQLADDADWLAREIPLPEHPAPRHPPIYYTTDPASRRAVPRRDALMRGDYVYHKNGSRLTGDDYIHPWQGPGHWPAKDDLKTRRWTACYSLELLQDGSMGIMFHWKDAFDDPYMVRSHAGAFHFSPCPPTPRRK